MSSEEVNIIKSIRSGDINLFQKLFDLYHKKIYNVSRNMGMSREDSEGIVQEVFLNIWKNRTTLDETLSINALLITITKRLVFKKIRRRAYNIIHRDYVKNTKSNRSNVTEDEVIYKDIKRFAEEGINRLSPIRKQVFIMSRQKGLSNDEIAKKLDVSKRTVENHIYRAIISIRKSMQREGVDIGLSLILLASGLI